MSILVLEFGRSAGSMRLGRMLTAHGHRLDVRHIWDGHPVPDDVLGIDGIVLMGGPESVAGAAPPWLEALCALVDRAVAGGLSVLGICLGCQVLARALGGEVGTLTQRRFGWHDVRLTPDGREDPLCARLPWTLHAFHHNADVVTRLPEEAVLLARGPDDDVQAWRMGHQVWACQFHPEITLASIDTWCREDAAQLAEAGGDTQSLQVESRSCFDEYARHTDGLFKAVAMLLLPLDARQDPRPVS